MSSTAFPFLKSGYTVYASHLCPSSVRVRRALKAVGATYQTLLVPALRTLDGTVMTESVEIIEHVVGAFPSSKLIPEDPAKRARLYDFIKIVGSRFRPSIYKSLMASNPEPAGRLRTSGNSPVVTGGPFWLDTRFGFAEIVLSPSVSVFGVLRHYRGVEIPDTQTYAAFPRWYNAFKSDPLFTEFEPDFEEQIVAFEKIVS
ncbi:hypothetical protein IWW48_004104 [Coemansia sp. RSA 1200]|nr:hypothetical protein IWW48_004104 [Coemansia sp. RSA 1200]